FRGKLIIADSTERNVVIPSSAPPQLDCGDRGCSVSLIYSTDGGRTFYGNRFMRSFEPYRDTEHYTLLVTKDAYFVEDRFNENFPSADRFPLIPRFRYGHDILPDADKVQYNTKMPSGLRSPSGQERFACDASIRPTNPDAPLK
ncbi:T6SS immunity protein Tli3 family protein, partial [Caballeronia glebae]